MSRPALVFDIETAADLHEPTVEQIRAKLKPPGNYKSAEAIAKWRGEAEEAITEKAALSPLTGRIVCVGMAIRWQDEWSEEVFLARDGDEAQVLRQFGEAWSDLTDRCWQHHSEDRCLLVGWNSRAFDLPFVAARAALHGMEFRRQLPAINDRRNHFDVMADALQERGLGPWSTRILGETKGGEGTQVEAMVREGRWSELAGYCLQDVRLTRQLFTRITQVVRT